MNASFTMSRFAAFYKMAANEPFRIFFPLGVLAGISGISLWPLFLLHVHDFYPAVMHARLMIEGFITAFIIGFLGTAAPRLTNTKPLSVRELTLLLALFLAVIGLQIGERPLAGDCAYFALLVVFISQLASRFSGRGKLPPPGFTLVALGFLNALIGSALFIFNGATRGEYPHSGILASLLLYQAFPILPVLGVGSFLLPRFLRLPQQVIAESRSPMSVWKRRAAQAVGTGALFMATFAADTWLNFPRLTALLRFLAATTFLLTYIPLHSLRKSFTIENCLRLALLMLIAGIAFPIFAPLKLITGMHLIFIGGLSLIVLTVSTRVMVGHSGQSRLFSQRLVFLILLAIAIVLAAALRIVGDYWLALRPQLLIAASFVWIIGVCIWGVKVLPKVLIPDSED